jgi:SHS2 domain-containing protein
MFPSCLLLFEGNVAAERRARPRSDDCSRNCNGGVRNYSRTGNLGLGLDARYDRCMATPSFEHFEHQADMGIRGFGRTREEAFEQAALALVAVSVPPAPVRERETVHVTCTAPDDELLLFDWLNAVVYQMATRRMAFARFAVRIAGEALVADLFGEPLDVARHQPGVEVKAATAAALQVARLADGTWLAQCVVDV